MQKYARESTEDFKNKMVEKGVTIVEVDLDEFREAIKPLYDQYQAEYGEQIAAIQALAK